MRRRPITALIVEDVPTDALLLQKSLRSLKICQSVQSVSDGESALAYLAGEDPFQNRRRFPRPSLVFLDLNLPRKSGFEVLAEIRQRPDFQAIAVIVLTGSSRTIDIYRAYELGANSYLVKPIHRDALESVCQSISWLVPATTSAILPESVHLHGLAP